LERPKRLRLPALCAVFTPTACVTAFTFGRNDDNADIYDDVDATPSFDYALGGLAGGGAAC
jgi:hypothetical protein